MSCLDAGIGPDRWWHADERLPAHPDTLRFYFVAIADAQAFSERFSCGEWIAGEWPHGHAARTDESERVGWRDAQDRNEGRAWLSPRRYIRCAGRALE